MESNRKHVVYKWYLCSSFFLIYNIDFLWQAKTNTTRQRQNAFVTTQFCNFPIFSLTQRHIFTFPHWISLKVREKCEKWTLKLCNLDFNLTKLIATFLFHFCTHSKCFKIQFCVLCEKLKLKMGKREDLSKVEFSAICFLFTLPVIAETKVLNLD